MAENIQVQYDRIAQIAQDCSGNAEDVKRLLGQILAKKELLQTRWDGAGARAFHLEMENEVLPALNKLRTIFTETGEVFHEITAIFSSAEQQAGDAFLKDKDSQLPGSKNMNDIVFDTRMGINEGFGDLPYSSDEYVNKQIKMWTKIGTELGKTFIKEGGTVSKGVPYVGAVVGTILDGVYGTDPDVARRWGSAVIGNGFTLIPVVGAVSGANSIVQGVGQLDVTGETYLNDILGYSPEAKRLMDETVGEFKDDLDRIDLGHLKLDIGRLGWDYITGGTNLTELVNNYKADPTNLEDILDFTIKNQTRMLTSTVFPAPIALPIQMVLYPEFGKAMLNDTAAIAIDTVDFGAGVIDLGTSFQEQADMYELALKGSLVKALPIPESWENIILDYYTREMQEATNQFRLSDYLPAPRKY
jgi:WXG100 family type VII secretion target